MLFYVCPRDGIFVPLRDVFLPHCPAFKNRFSRKIIEEIIKVLSAMKYYLFLANLSQFRCNVFPQTGLSTNMYTLGTRASSVQEEKLPLIFVGSD